MVNFPVTTTGTSATIRKRELFVAASRRTVGFPLAFTMSLCSFPSGLYDCLAEFKTSSHKDNLPCLSGKDRRGLTALFAQPLLSEMLFCGVRSEIRSNEEGHDTQENHAYPVSDCHRAILQEAA